MKTKNNMVVCVNNAGFEASLERRKLYRTLPDAKAESLDMIRIVDESGEDYLFPISFFMPIELPTAVRRALQVAA